MRKGEFQNAINRAEHPPCRGCPHFTRCARNHEACEKFRAWVDSAVYDTNRKYNKWIAEIGLQNPSRLEYKKVFVSEFQ